MTAYYEERIADSLKKIVDAVEKIADVLTSTEAVNFAKQASVGGVEIPAPYPIPYPDFDEPDFSDYDDGHNA